MLERLRVARKLGTEQFRIADSALGISLLDFWQWASSDLASNALRGRLAEFIVAHALGVADGMRSEWDAHDLTLPNGLKVEVKSSAYVQSWAQKADSVPTFDIKPTLAWDANTNSFAHESQRRRQADIYVFALLAHRDRTSLDPLELSQWAFYLLLASKLDQRMPTQKRLSLASLSKLGAVQTSFANLKESFGALGSKTA